MRRYASWVVAHSWLVIAAVVLESRRRIAYGCFAACALFGLSGAAQVTPDSSVKRYFFSSHPAAHDDVALNAALSGTNTMYLLVRGDAPDTIKRPDVLQAMQETQQFLERQPHVGKTLSVVDFIRLMHRALHGDDPAFDRIPESQELVAQYLLLYSMSGDPDDFDRYVDAEFRTANVTVMLQTDSTAYLRELIARVEPFMRTRFPADVHVAIGGSVAEAAAINEVIVHGKILNIVQISLVIFAIAALLFRSLTAGVLVLIPLVLAVIVDFGVVGWLGVPLNSATATISATVVGIGADYAIYLLYRIREHLAAGSGLEEALRSALQTAGTAVMFVASAIAAGYAVLLLSWGFFIHIWLGSLIGIAMVVSALTVLILVPSLILTFRPRFLRVAATDAGARSAPVAHAVAG